MSEDPRSYVPDLPEHDAEERGPALPGLSVAAKSLLAAPAQLGEVIDWYPKARRIPLPATAYWPAENTPIAVVHHIAEGYWTTLTDPGFWIARGSSVHFAISRGGEVAQLVPLSGAAWGNGWVREPTWPLLEPGTNPNRYTISIEHEGFTGKPWTSLQIAASADLTIWLLGRILQQPPDHLHVIGHCEIDSITRANCPGTAWPQDEILESRLPRAPFTPSQRQAVARIAAREAREALAQHRRTYNHNPLPDRTPEPATVDSERRPE